MEKSFSSKKTELKLFQVSKQDGKYPGNVIWQLKTKGTVTFPWSVNQKYDQKWKNRWKTEFFVTLTHRLVCEKTLSLSCQWSPVTLKKAMAILTNIVKISPHGKLKWNTALDNPRKQTIKLSLISQQHKLRFKNFMVYLGFKTRRKKF